MSMFVIRTSVRFLFSVWLCSDCNRPPPFCLGNCGEGR